MKKIVMTAALLITGTLVTSYFAWRQATQLPEWHARQETTQTQFLGTADVGVQSQPQPSAKERLQQKIAVLNETNQEVTPAKAQIQLKEDELNEVVVAAIADTTPKNQLLKAAQSFNTTIKDNKLESGVVIKLSDVPTEELKDSEKAFLEKVTQTFPFLAHQSIYVGIEGQPKVTDGQLELDDTTTVKLGNLSLPLADLVQRLGWSEEQIERKVRLQFKVGRLNVQDIELAGDTVLLKGLIE